MICPFSKTFKGAWATQRVIYIIYFASPAVVAAAAVAGEIIDPALFT